MTDILTSLLTLCVPCLVSAEEKDLYAADRIRMVEQQIIRRGIADQKVIEAMKKIKRHLFVPEDAQAFAYKDHPVSIGYGQTISQPYIVAYMTEAARLKEGDRVLEIGTGSGYQAAVLAEIVKEVYTLEILKPLADSVGARLRRLGYGNIFTRLGDGYLGWEEHAPFDVILVTAAADDIPEGLVAQLKVGGRMVIPAGSSQQKLYLITKTEEGFDHKELLPVRFVLMVHEAER
ncbi:MAG: protein-L-isoaspartate(D-aspartate) O-methyltransferase [Candidatus Omnitrophota bacterium]